MKIFIDSKSGVNMTNQIFEQIKGHIIKGTLKPNEELPSIRELAEELEISVMTTKRAYNKLTETGYICTTPGKGSYVAPDNGELIQEEKLKDMEKLIKNLVQTAKEYGLTLEDIIEMISFEMEDD